jgi:hypothetical protein
VLSSFALEWSFALLVFLVTVNPSHMALGIALIFVKCPLPLDDMTTLVTQVPPLRLDTGFLENFSRVHEYGLPATSLRDTTAIFAPDTRNSHIGAQ